MSLAIEIINLSKTFKNSNEKKLDSLRDVISNSLRKKPPSEGFVVFENLNLQILKGETIGIVGKNGSGKSTLLKILSRVMYPSSGSVKIDGRLISLLELGAGFHPELTGEENIYLNGAIFGMTKEYMDSTFNQIVDFAGVGDFLFSPVKYYSSGMYLRLAFSIAAHLKFDILILDEILAVGDREFQQKCANWFENIKSQNKTILIVSHNEATLNRICDKIINFEQLKLGR